MLYLHYLHVFLYLLLILVCMFLDKSLDYLKNKEYVEFNVYKNISYSDIEKYLKILIQEAYFKDKILILPYFVVKIKENDKLKKIKINLNKYYNLDNVKLNNENFKIMNQDEKIIDKNYIETVNIDTYPITICPNIKYSNNNIEIYIPYQKPIIELANKIIRKLNLFIFIFLGKNYINNIDSKNNTRKLSKIIKSFFKINPSINFYIMTERNSYNKLLKIYEKYKNNLFFYTNFIELKKIKDDFYLYCIEKNIKLKSYKFISLV